MTITPIKDHPASDEPGSVAGITVEEMTASLTGFDEIAISKMFGHEVGDLPGTQPLRALVMVWHKHSNGLDDKAAYDVAMNLSLKECLRYFDEDLEITPDRPETESGKDSALGD